MSTSSTTTTRAFLEVTSPLTRLSVGELYGMTSYAGIGIDTDESVRFYAHGDSASSDVIGQATGQIWLQSMQNVAVLAKKKIVVSSESMTALASGRGVTLLCGFSPPSLSIEESAGSKPSAIDTYQSTADLVSGIWIGFNAVSILSIGLLKICHTIAGGKHSWVGTEAAVMGVAGAVLNAVTLAGSNTVRVPGINIFSVGGIVGNAGNFSSLWSMFGSVSLTGVAGTIISAPFLSCASAFSSKIRGWLRTAMVSLGYVTVSAIRDLGVTGDMATSVSARTGTLEVLAANVVIGTPQLPKPWAKPPQLPTTGVKLFALNTLELNAVGEETSMKALKITSAATANTSIEGTSKATMKMGVFEVTVKTAGVKVGSSASKAGITALTSALVISGGLGKNKAFFGATALAFQTTGGKMEVTPGATLKVDGMELKLQ